MTAADPLLRPDAAGLLVAGTAARLHGSAVNPLCWTKLAWSYSADVLFKANGTNVTFELEFSFQKRKFKFNRVWLNEI